MSTPHIVGFLGRGNLRGSDEEGYKRTLYRDPSGGWEIPALNAPHYLAQRYGLTEIHLLVTWQVATSQDEKPSELERLQTQLDRLDPPCRIIDHRIPMGRDDTELWSIFHTLLAAIQAAANKPVVLDVTHGFRHAPMLALSAAQYLEALPGGEAPTIERVHYAALDMARAQDEADEGELGYAPVLDLAPLVELQRWTRDVAVLQHTGRSAPLASRLALLFAGLAEQAKRQGWSPSIKNTLGSLRTVSGSLKQLDTDLLTLRTGDAVGPGGSVPRIAGMLRDEGVIRLVRQHAPPLAPLLGRIAAGLEPIADGDAAHLARWFLDRGHVVQAISVGFEELTNVALSLLGRPRTEWTDTGTRGAVETALRGLELDDTKHDDASAAILEELNASPHAALLKTVARARERFKEHRNDVLHAGQRPDPTPGEAIHKSAKKLVDSLEDLRTRAAAVTPAAAPPEARAER